MNYTGLVPKEMGFASQMFYIEYGKALFHIMYQQREDLGLGESLTIYKWPVYGRLKEQMRQQKVMEGKILMLKIFLFSMLVRDLRVLGPGGHAIYASKSYKYMSY